MRGHIRVLSGQPKFKFLFLAQDFICLSTAIILSITAIYCSPEFKQTEFYTVLLSSFQVFLLLIFTSLFSLLYNNLYKRDVIITIYRHEILIIKALIIAGIISAGILFVSYNFNLLAFEFRDILIKYLLYSIVLLTLFRVLLCRWLFIFLAKKRIFQTRILIIGADQTAVSIGSSLLTSKFSDFRIVGYLDDRKPVDMHIHDTYHNLGNLESINRIVEDTDTDEILIAIDNLSYERMITIVNKCLRTKKVVRIYSNLLEVIADKLQVEMYAGVPVVMFNQSKHSRLTLTCKRLIDIVLSFSALILLIPVFILIAAGIKLSSRQGPVFFKQTRIGLNGKPFNFYKFRSMHMGKSNEKHKEFVQDFIKNKNDSRDKNIRIFKITDDPRIFRFGKFIRKTSLDEFPQFYNVLKGDMSLVGPRPCLPYEWECYTDWHRKRLNVLPGCTGLWQAVGRSKVSFEEMVILDLYYISRMSIWLDFKIILNTIPVIFFAKGAH